MTDMASLYLAASTSPAASPYCILDLSEVLDYRNAALEILYKQLIEAGVLIL